MNSDVQNKNYSNSKNPIIKLFAIIGAIIVVIVLVIIVIFSIASASSNKLVCKSEEGNITIMYNDSEIVGYTANNISYDLDQQKQYAKQVGIKSYLDEFNSWFKNNTSGSCSIKEK